MCVCGGGGGGGGEKESKLAKVHDQLLVVVVVWRTAVQFVACCLLVAYRPSYMRVISGTDLLRQFYVLPH